MARKDGKDRGIFERPKGSGEWWVRYHDHLGAERRKKIGPKSAALAYYQEQKSKVRQVQRYPELAEKLFGTTTKPLTLRDLIKTYFPNYKTASPQAGERRYAPKWIKRAGSTPITEVTRPMIRQGQAALLEKGLSPSTVNRDIGWLKALFSRAADDGLIEVNPLHRMPNIKEDNIRHRFLLEPEEDRLGEVMKPDEFELVIIAIDTGLRQKEQFGLAWSQVTFEHDGWVTVKGKGGKTRTVPLTPRVLEILQRRYANRTSAFVFPNTKGRPMSGVTFYTDKFKPALEAAGLVAGQQTADGVVWHTLRHTCGSRMALKGVSLQKIAKVLGHSRTSTTERYAHLQPDSAREAISALIRGEDSRGGLRAVK